jgi:CspA family cold shock protein
MTFRDTLVTCAQCGREFVFRVERQRELAERGEEVLVPELCPDCRQRIQYGGKLHGRVKWFDRGKGYGFIVQDAGDEIFFHHSNIVQEEGELPSLEEGQEVLYETTETAKGPAATQVQPIGAERRSSPRL